MGELLSLRDLRQMDLQAKVYAPAGGATLQRIRPAIENPEINFMKFNEPGGPIDDKSKKNILLKIIPKAVADPLITTLQNCPTYAALKQHAMYKADLLMKFHPDASKVANLAQRRDESDDGWPEGDLECNLCNEDAPDVAQQLMAVF